MAYDLEEQESLAEIKAWWDKWGTPILSVVTVACLALAGYQGWNWYKMKQASDASALYAELIQAEGKSDVARVQAIAKRLQDEYGSTGFAPMGSMMAAKSAELKNNADQAQKNLEWIVKSSSAEDVKGIAAVRLAGLQMDAGKYDEALATLDTVKTPDQQVLVEDRRGDIFAAMGKVSDARKSWEAALKIADVTHPMARLINLKLTALPKA